MRLAWFLPAFAFIAFMAGCGGGGGAGASAGSSGPTLQVSPTSITVSGSSQDVPPPATVTLTVEGAVPAAGLYYGWKNTSNMIQSITSNQTTSSTITLTVTFAWAGDRSAGTYQDTIQVGVATDQAGQNMIAGSPQTVQVTYHVLQAAAPLTMVNPASGFAGGPAFTLTVTGQALPADAQVFWNGSPMPTTWVSATTLTASIPASALATAGTAQVTVAGKDLEPSQPIPFPIANAMATQLNGGLDCVWDGVHGLLYTSLPQNSVTSLTPLLEAIDPATGKVTALVPFPTATAGVGGPSNLAISDDCSFLYAFVYDPQPGVQAAIQRFLLPSLTLDPTFSVPMATDPATGYAYWVGGMAVAPGAPDTLAVTLYLGSESAGVEILDGGRVRGQAVLVPPADQASFTALAWGGDASTLYVLEGTITYQLATVAVGSCGPAVTTQVPVAFPADQWPGNLQWEPANGYLYAASGQVIDPASGTVVTTFGNALAGLAVDPDLKQVFYLDDAPSMPAGLPWGFEVQAFDLVHFNALAQTYVPVQVDPTNYGIVAPMKLLRAGPSMLVVTGGDQLANPIWVLTGPFAQGH